jgi:hypothetical protein
MEYRSTVNAPQGSGPRGIDWADVEHKFRTLFGDAGIDKGRSEAILETVHRFDQLSNVDELNKLVCRG